MAVRPNRDLFTGETRSGIRVRPTAAGATRWRSFTPHGGYQPGSPHRRLSPPMQPVTWGNRPRLEPMQPLMEQFAARPEFSAHSPLGARIRGHRGWCTTEIGSQRLPKRANLSRGANKQLSDLLLWSGWPDLNRRPLRPEQRPPKVTTRTLRHRRRTEAPLEVSWVPLGDVHDHDRLPARSHTEDH